MDLGKSITLKRDPNYWGRALPINRGQWNFAEMRFDYYRDANAFFEAFKTGLYDVRAEQDPSRWQTGYDIPAVRDGRIVKEAFASGQPKLASNFVFNTRRAIFADIRVRQAIALLFDAEWVNRNFFFGLYRRSASFFDGSELSAFHRAADARERALLAPFPGTVRADVLDGTWSPPASDGSGRDRKSLRASARALTAAGYELKGTELRARADGRPLSFRDHGDEPRRGTARARLRRQSRPRRHPCAGTAGRCGAIRSAPACFRFRHDRVPLGRVAVARQRTEYLLRLGRRR